MNAPRKNNSKTKQPRLPPQKKVGGKKKKRLASYKPKTYSMLHSWCLKQRKAALVQKLCAQPHSTGMLCILKRHPLKPIIVTL